MERKQKNKEKGNGEGTLYKSSKTGLYIGQYVYNGKRHSVYQKKNEKIGDFKKRFADILSSINTGTYIEKDSTSLLSILENHIEQKFQDGITEETSYARDLETLSQIKICCKNFIDKPIQKITVEDIEDSKSKIRNYSKSCIDKIWRLLKKGFKIAYSRRKIFYNIMEDETLTKPISKKSTIKVSALSIDEENRLINVLNNESNSNEQYNRIILLQLYTGARIGEILAISNNDIDLQNNTLTICKTLTKNKNKETILGEHTKTYNKINNIDRGMRTFPMISKVRKIIEEQQNSKIANIYNLLFWDFEDNTFVKYYEINSYLRRLNEKYKICNFSLSTHNLRHTFITRCQENDIKLPILQSLVGHVEGSNITTDVYTDVSLEFMSKELNKISL